MSGVRTDLTDSQHTLLTTDPLLNVYVSGPNPIEQTGTYTYDAIIENEHGPVSYNWSILWEGSNTWNYLGTSSSQSVSVLDDKDFTIRVEVTDGIDNDTGSQSVIVTLDCTTGPCSF